MAVTIESSTDTPEQVTAAIGGAPAKDESKVEKEQSASDAKASDETPDESDASETEQDADNDTDVSDDEESSESEAKPDDKKPKKNGFKKRIDKLISSNTAKDQQIEYWKAEALKRQEAEKEAEEPKAQKTAPSEGEPNPDDFESHADYIRAVTKFEVAQAKKADAQSLEEKSLKEKHAASVTAHNERVAKFTETHTDYEEVVTDAIEELGNPQFSPAFAQALMGSENGPAIFYELAKDPAQLAKFNSLSYGELHRAIGRLEAGLEKEAATPKTENKKSKAPPPLTPVGARSSGSSKDPENMSYQEYKKWREASQR